jgi:hypothetical protein
MKTVSELIAIARRLEADGQISGAMRRVLDALELMQPKTDAGSYVDGYAAGCDDERERIAKMFEDGEMPTGHPVAAGMMGKLIRESR